MITYIEINRDALRHNLAQVLGHLAPGSRLLAVVKANAYGHGLVEAARTFVSGGAQWLGVSEVSEGVALRDAGLDTPILVFLPALDEEFEALLHNGLTATVVSVPGLRALAAASSRLGHPASCHVYVDSGLGRIGSDDRLPDLVETSRAFPHIEITGAYTHFGPPGSGRLLEEIDVLREGASVKGFAALAREAFAEAGYEPPLIHVSASSLFVESPQNHLDLVRVGNLLYGQYPDHLKPRPLKLRDDTFALRSRIIALQTLPKGSRVGYGGDFICRRDTRVATIPVGVAHGLSLVPESAAGRPRSAVRAVLARREGRAGKTSYAPQAHVLDRRVPLIGRVSMDQCCLDVTDLQGVEVGTQVTLPVRRLSASANLPRVYIEDPGP